FARIDPLVDRRASQHRGKVLNAVVGNNLVLVIVLEIGRSGGPAITFIGNTNFLVDAGFRFQVRVAHDPARAGNTRGASHAHGHVKIAGIGLVQIGRLEGARNA